MRAWFKEAQEETARGKFVQPQASMDAIQELEDLASPVGAFVRDRCVLGPDESIQTDTLYKAYKEYCIDHGLPPSSQPTFGRDLRAMV